jgi:RHS repeat-associated protein
MGSSASQTFDALGRVSGTTNPLGSFPYSYDGLTSRPQFVSFPNGHWTSYNYFPNSGDHRLQRLQHTSGAGATLVSQFDYLYDAEGEITQWTKQLCPTCYGVRWYGASGSMLDAADQLTNVTIQTSSTSSTTSVFSYDQAGNRSDVGSYNNVNQLTNAGYTYDLNGNLTADSGHTYEWDAANRLTAINYTGKNSRSEFTYDGLNRRVKIVEKSPAVLSMTVQPVDKNYGTFTSATVAFAAGSYTLTVTGLNPYGGDNTAFVDAVKLNGTLVSNGGFETPVLATGAWVYQPSGATWTFTGTSGIAKNNSAFTSTNPVAPEGTQVAILQQSGRATHPLSLTAGNYSLNLRAAQRGSINPSSQQLLVTIDGSAQVVQSTKQFIWNGTSMAEERDVSNVVTRRFYAEGEQISGGNYYYTRDHLGSVREMAGPAGAIRAQYDYNMFGVRAKVQGDLDASLGFTGDYYHVPSGLYLTLYRAYDPISNRWLSRDPIGEAGGINLYGYVRNDAMNFLDPDGLDAAAAWAIFGRSLARAGAAEAVGLGPEDPIADVIATGLVVAGLYNAIHALHEDGQEPETQAVDGEGKVCPPKDLTPTGDPPVDVPSTKKGNDGGRSVEEPFTDPQGRPVTKHTIYDPKGKIIDQHYRPGKPKYGP